MSNRKALSDKLRFEVFKRDQFRCQYCGGSAPEVILNVDHIHPVSKGGDNDILNLITSCRDCNSGKSDRVLNDTTVLDKQRKLLEELDEKRKQLMMMIEWRDELKNFDHDVCLKIKEIIEQKIHPYLINENGLEEIRSWMKKYDFQQILDAIDKTTIFKTFDGAIDAEKIFSSIPKVAYFNNRPPAEKEARYIRGILKNRLSYINEKQVIPLILEALFSGMDGEEIRAIAKRVSNWSEFQKEIQE